MAARRSSKPLAFAAAFSLMLAGAMGVLWKRRYQVVQPDPPSWRMFFTRYTWRPDHGKLVFFAPPRNPAPARPDAQFWIEKLAKKDTGWRFTATRTDEGLRPLNPRPNTY